MDTKTVSGRHSKFSSQLKPKASLRSVTFDDVKKVMDSWHVLLYSDYYIMGDLTILVTKGFLY
jgi:hypothetical protein